MRDPEERTRHFVVGKKKEEDFDEPAVRRKSPERDEPEAKEEQEEQGARKGYFVRRSLREREIEEAQQHRQAIRRARGEDYDEPEEEEYDEYEEEDYGEERAKAPLMVRIFSWGALLAIFFVGGYLGANYFFDWADSKGGPRIGNVVGSPTDLANVPGGGETAGVGDASYTIYFLDGASFTQREIKFRKGLPEEDIQRLLTVYIDSLKETSALSTGVQLLSIYRSGDWLYVDLTGAFEASLKTLGKDRATAVITGLVKTMQENFPPVKKVKFYIDGKESKEKNPVDLTSAWELQG